MKGSTVFFVIGIIVIGMGLAWIISGGIVEPVRDTVPQTSSSPPAPVTVPVTTSPGPVTTVPATALTAAVPAVTTTRVTTTAALPSSDDIRNHFLDVAYTSTNRIERLNYSSSKPRIIISAVSADTDDIALIEKIARDFNDASTTVEMSENIKETSTGDLMIKFLPEDGLIAVNLFEAPETGPFPDVLTRRELYQGSIPAAKIVRGTVYINANLKGDTRRHVVVRSLMYEMGLTGETTKFTDSIFYAGENTNVNLSPLDKKVIAMLYGKGFSNGMTIEDVRKVVYIP